MNERGGAGWLWQGGRRCPLANSKVQISSLHIDSMKCELQQLWFYTSRMKVKGNFSKTNNEEQSAKVLKGFFFFPILRCYSAPVCFCPIIGQCSNTWVCSPILDDQCDQEPTKSNKIRCVVLWTIEGEQKYFPGVKMPKVAWMNFFIFTWMSLLQTLIK